MDKGATAEAVGDGEPGLQTASSKAGHRTGPGPRSVIGGACGLVWESRVTFPWLSVTHVTYGKVVELPT